MFIDTHAHLQWKDYKDELDQILENADAGGIEYILNVGTTLETSRQGVELARNHERVYASIGIHPHDAGNASVDYIEKLKDLARDPGVIAIGEIGLDLFYENSPRDQQFQVFEQQLQLAKALNLPVSIHCRNAFEDCFHFIKKTGPLRQGGVFHCFTGTKDEAKKACDMGFFISISGIVTFKKAQQLQEVVKEMPLEKMLIETDCPYLAPEPYRGKRNEPAYVIHTAKKIAEIKNIPFQEVGDITTENAKKLFQFKRKER